jgi:hypothetical protein
LTSNLCTSAQVFACKYKGLFSVLCFSCRNNKSRKTVKLVTLIIATSVRKPTSLESRYASISTSKRPNRPHISSDIINVKEQKTKTTDRAKYLAQPPPYLRVICAASTATSTPVPSLPTVCSSSVRQLLGPPANSRKRKNHFFCHFSVSSNVYWGKFFVVLKSWATLPLGKARPNRQIGRNAPESDSQSR